MCESDFMDLAKCKTYALSAALSNNGELFAIYSRDRKIRIFDIKSGKLIRTIDDSI